MPELSKNEQKRLTVLQQEAAKPAGGYSFAIGLTVPDLLLMLRHDPGLQALVAAVARLPQTETRLEDAAVPAQPAAARPAPAALAAPAAPAPAALQPPPADPLRDSLASPLRLLALLERDAALSSAWFGSLEANQSGPLTRLIVHAGHWDRIEALWDLLAQRCKHEQRGATGDEVAIVEECVRIHNLLWTGRQAHSVTAAADTPFDFAAHERGNTTGQQVRETWLPGLKNAAGQLRKKTLVLTR